MKHIFAVLVPLSLLPVCALGQSPTPPAVTDKNSPDYVRCETHSEIGSRARKTRICHTNAEWQKLKDISSKQARELGDPGRRSAPAGQ